MIGLTSEEAGKRVHDAILIKRQDIARAKTWILNATGDEPNKMVDEWLREQGIVETRQVDTDAEDCNDKLTAVAQAYSTRLAFYRAIWELVSSAQLVSSGSTGQWEPRLQYKTSRGAGPITIKTSCPYPEKIWRPQSDSMWPEDIDIFMGGNLFKTLHPGILQAIEESINCFRRGLYMPATAMLAAAAEATWIECGTAVAKKLSDANLSSIVTNSHTGIAKIVFETRKALENQAAKTVLQAARLTIHQVRDAEVWTTVLRDKRNALHWSKAKSFAADHSETGTLLMGAPQHLGALELIRQAC